MNSFTKPSNAVILPIPGANAAITALVASGLATDSFTFIGFLPKKQNARRDILQSLKNERRTLIAYESPHRVADTLGQVAAILGDERQVCIARELTKKFEEFWRGTAKEAVQHFNNENPKGEVTLLIEGAAEAVDWNKSTVMAALESKLDEGMSLSQASKEVASLSGWKKRAVYELGLQD